MPIIKTKEWLGFMLKKNNMTYKKLAEKAGVSHGTIAKIMQGDRIGSNETWIKISQVFPAADYFVEEVSIMDRLRRDAFMYRDEARCVLFYDIADDGRIIFKDYTFEGMYQNQDFKKELADLSVVHVSLKEALQLCKDSKNKYTEDTTITIQVTEDFAKKYEEACAKLEIDQDFALRRAARETIERAAGLTKRWYLENGHYGFIDEHDHPQDLRPDEDLLLFESEEDARKKLESLRLLDKNVYAIIGWILLNDEYDGDLYLRGIDSDAIEELDEIDYRYN